MSYFRAFAFAAVCFSLAAAAQEPDTSRELISTEQAFNSALTHGDWRAVEALMGEDLVFTDSDGTLSGKSEQVSEVKSGYLKLESIEMSEVRVQDLGNVAVVTGKLVEKGRYKGADVGGVYRFTDVWAKRSGKWQLVAGQETRRPKPN
jgi:ketosteroid isomerase-like protein